MIVVVAVMFGSLINLIFCFYFTRFLGDNLKAVILHDWNVNCRHPLFMLLIDLVPVCFGVERASIRVITAGIFDGHVGLPGYQASHYN